MIEHQMMWPVPIVDCEVDTPRLRNKHENIAS